LAKQAALSAKASASLYYPTNVQCKLCINTENYDIQNEYNNVVVSGTTDSAAALKLIDSTAHFQTGGVLVGAGVLNTTDKTYTYVTAVDSETQLSVATAVPNGKAYKVYNCRYTASVAGVYLAVVMVYFTAAFLANSYASPRIFKNGGLSNLNAVHSAVDNYFGAVVLGTAQLAINDYLEPFVYFEAGASLELMSTYTTFEVVKLT